jgi:hypothetical protein
MFSSLCGAISRRLQLPSPRLAAAILSVCANQTASSRGAPQARLEGRFQDPPFLSRGLAAGASAPSGASFEALAPQERLRMRVVQSTAALAGAWELQANCGGGVSLMGSTFRQERKGSLRGDDPDTLHPILWVEGFRAIPFPGAESVFSSPCAAICGFADGSALCLSVVPRRPAGAEMPRLQRSTAGVSPRLG